MAWEYPPEARLPMATLPQDPATSTPRRLLIIDFDWRDVDWLPELFRNPGTSVRLVAGDGPQDPGVRVAELCGLPRTVDLADLTREIFDVALVGERSSRRTQLESLLVALGTPCMTPEEFLRGPAGSSRPGVDATLAVHAAALEQTLAGPAPGAMDTLLERALPDLSETTPLESRLHAPPAEPRVVMSSLDDFPSREMRLRLEEALRQLVSHTGAGSAEVHTGDKSQMRLVAQVGPNDRLLKGLIDQADELDAPQLMTRLNEPGKGKTWAAWPFRTLQRRGILAGSAIEPSGGLDSWRRMLEDLRSTWDLEDREHTVASFPLTPVREHRWLAPAELRQRVELAVERHRRDGLRFELHRLEFPELLSPWTRFAETLPTHLRDTDGLTRSFPRLVVLVAALDAEAFVRLRRRLLAVWELAWEDAGLKSPAASFVDHSVTLMGPEDIEAFTTSADVWLAEAEAGGDADA